MSEGLRFAAGVCLVSTTLLIGSAGGGIALADTGSAGSADQDRSASTPGESSSTGKRSVGSGADTSGSAADDVADARRSFGQPNQGRSASQGSGVTESSTTSGSETPEPGQVVDDVIDVGGGDADTGTSDEADLVAETETETDLVAETETETETTPAPETEPGAATETEPAAVTEDVQTSAPVSEPDGASEPAATSTASDSAAGPTPVAASTVERTPIPVAMATAAEPVLAAALSLAEVLVSTPGTVLMLPASATPVSDVIALIEKMLTSVGGVAVSLVELPVNLSSLLGVQVANPPVMNSPIDPTVTREAIPVPAPAPQPALSVPSPGSQILGVPMSDQEVSLSTLDSFATAPLGHGAVNAEAAPSAQETTSASGALSFSKGILGALLVPLSLMALAAVVVPALCGLLVIHGAGIRIGYRQAKAGLALRAAGIARFAGPGPLGVVRSGTLVAPHRPRVAKLVRQESASTGRVPDDFVA